MSVLALKRPPHDSFSFRLFFKLSNKIPNADKIYIWSIVIESGYELSWLHNEEVISESEPEYRQKLIKSINSQTVIFGVKDHLTVGNFNPWIEDKPSSVIYLEDMVKFYHDKNFILFTSLENLDKYLSLPNLRIISWGGDITNQESEYRNLKPVIEKNLSSPYSYISLNRNHRDHRTVALAKIFSLGLEKHGLISCMFQNKLTELPKWPFSKTDSIFKGFEDLKKYSFNITDDENIYGKNPNSNVENFDLKLRDYYSNVFVELINETSFTETCFNLTEKTLNCFYGCNFPIMLSSQGSVEFLRNVGFDMFDDVVDHSYDLINNPIDRIHAAIYNNRNLLMGKGKELWPNYVDRFLSNVEVAKTKMYTYYSNRAQMEFNKVLDENIYK